MTSFFRQHRALLGLVLIALLLRLLLVLVIDSSPDFEGNDANWYMQYGHDLMYTGKTMGPPPTAPLYLMFVGGIQRLIPGEPHGDEMYTYADMQAIRLTQAVLGALLVVFIYVIGQRWVSARAGWIAAIITAISPTLILEVGHITSEGVFLFCMLSGLAVYAAQDIQPTRRGMALTGILLALATLTRAVFLLFPLILVLHLWLNHRRRWIQLALLLLLSYGALNAMWTGYNLAVWHRVVIGSDGLLSFIHQGAEGKSSPQEYDESLGIEPGVTQAERDEKLREGITDSILSSPLVWAQHRVKELVSAYLQPHNTTYFKGESIREAGQNWLQHDRSLSGLRKLPQIEAFWPKLLLYVFHFGALILGAGGMFALRGRWRTLVPLYGVIAYFTGIHLILLALPRYLFPTYPIFNLFAAGVIARWRLLRPANAR